MQFIRKVKNQKGQGVIEYILLLVVVVSIVIGFSMKIYQPLGRYVNNYVGEYLECLLETGQLPVINDGADLETECSRVFRAGNEFAGSTAANQANQNKDAANGKSKTSNSGAGSGESANSAGGSNKNYFLNGKNSGGGMSDGGGSSASVASEESKYTGSTGSSSRGRSMSVYSRGDARVIRSIPITNYEFLRRQKQREKTKVRNLGAAESEQDMGKLKKLQLKKKEANRKLAEVQEEDFSFGKIFRLFIIALILILILIVVGGEATSVFRNMD